ncbi:MAG TPA: DUF692 family protein [Kofleriaceae bacterium]|nr:DUF692 family protein [Kofleriaceae bacterium]
MAVKGVGLQVNPTILGMLDELDPGLYAFSELLCDQFAAPLDCGYVLDPVTRPLLEQLRASHPLLAHGNYGNEFGYDPIDETPGVLRHIAIAHDMKSPWYADHMFFGFQSSSYMWSSPLQFSRSEIERVAGRAAALQDRLKMPLLHENAFYYAPFPGAELAEAEFIAGLVERAQTYLLLDLHNVYSNSVNFEGYDRWQYLRTIPLDRVIEVHLAGGEQIEDWYHDFHNHHVPEPVWEMLDYVLRHAPRLEAVTLEVQGPAHSAKSRPVGAGWAQMIRNDLTRAGEMWRARRGAPAAG